MPSTLQASAQFHRLFRPGPERPSRVFSAAVALFLAAGLSGCTLGVAGLPGGIPRIGGGTFFINTSVMPDGVVNRSYNRVMRFQGGLSPIKCVLVGTLPAGLSLTSLGSTCSVTGVPTATGSLGFTIQATDNSTPGQFSSGTFTINVRSEFSIGAVVLPDAVQGRAYGTAAGTTAPVANSSISATAGNAPLASCVVTVIGSTAPVNGSFTGALSPAGPGATGCALSSALVATLAPPANAGLTVSFALTDTAILDPDSAVALTVVPAATIMLAGQPLMADQALSFSRNLNPAVGAVPDAVVARPYGMAPQTALIYTVQGGVTASRSITAGALPGGLACSPPPPTTMLTCSSPAIIGPTGPTTIPITANDGGNSAVLPGSTSTDVNGNLTQALTIQPSLNIAPFNPLPNGTQNKAYSAQNFVTSGGIQPIAMCQSLPALPTGLNITPAVANCAVAGTPTVAAPSPGQAITVTATDTGNAAVPAGMAPTPSNITVNPPLDVTPF